jgi:hypothetical protein
MYDEAAISAELRMLAARADDEYRMRALEPLTSGQDDRDEILARSCVYSYLYDRHFLESPEKLVNELKWLKQTKRPHAPNHAQSVEQFQAARDSLLDELIVRFVACQGRPGA